MSMIIQHKFGPAFYLYKIVTITQISDTKCVYKLITNLFGIWRPIHLHHVLSLLRINGTMLFQVQLAQEYFLWSD